MFKRSQAPRGAFTLIEILVVIGVIALLSAILFPVLSRARETGRKAVCNSNMHQLGMAFAQYTQDSGGRYPFAGQLQLWANGAHWITGGDKATGTPTNYTGTSAGQFGLADPTTFDTITDHEAMPEKGALFPYAKSATVYMCPSAKDSNVKKLSYSMNCAIAGISTVRIRDTAEIILLVDEGDTINDGYLWATQNAASTDSLFQGHNGTGNLLFVDGHVKAYDFDALPIDKGDAGQLIKSRTGRGQVRFRDLAFGPKGANYIAALNPDKDGKYANSCSESIPTPGT